MLNIKTSYIKNQTNRFKMTHYLQLLACITLILVPINSIETHNNIQNFNLKNNLKRQIHSIQANQIVTNISQDKPEKNLKLRVNRQDNYSTNHIYSNPRNHTFAIAGILAAGSTALAGAVSSGLSLAGFTSGGVAAGSVAAGVHSGIGIVQAGSVFSYLQSAGALGSGIIGGYAIPVIAGVVILVGGYILVDKFVLHRQ